jgi:hypothetical protein
MPDRFAGYEGDDDPRAALRLTPISRFTPGGAGPGPLG